MNATMTHRSIWLLIGFLILSLSDSARAQTYPCDTPMAITTPEQAIERVRADLLEPGFFADFSDENMKTLSRELLTLHVIPLDTNEGYHYYYGTDAPPGNDAKYFWGVQSLENRNETFLVNRKTGFVTIGEPLRVNQVVGRRFYVGSGPIHFTFTPPYGPHYEPKVVPEENTQPVVHDDREGQEAYQLGIHHYRVQERANDYLLTVLFNPAISGSPSDFEFTVHISTMENWVHPEAKSIIIGRIEHIQNMETASFVISKETLKTYSYITGWTVGLSRGQGTTFLYSKPPDDKDQPWR